MRKAKYIIVGQGIAGTVLAFQLLQRRVPFVLIDHGANNSASAVSSGLINPITGRNFVKSWMIDALLPAAHLFYKNLSEYLGTSIVRHAPIHRHLSGIVDENLWLSQSDRPDYSHYMDDNFSMEPYSSYLRDAQSFATVRGGMQIDAGLAISEFRKRLKKQGLSVDEIFKHDSLKCSNDYVSYNDIEADHIIFAEGAGVLNNPFFNELAFQPARGEVAITNIPSVPTEIVKYKKFLVPIGTSKFWIGSTYNWDFGNNARIDKDIKSIEEFLKTNLKCDYEILEWKSGIRPATKYRRPFIGTHHTLKNVHLFNGLGTKGMSLAPYWGLQLLDHIELGKPLDAEVRLYNR